MRTRSNRWQRPLLAEHVIGLNPCRSDRSSHRFESCIARYHEPAPGGYLADDARANRT
jgi:hypothetical protein